MAGCATLGSGATLSVCLFVCVPCLDFITSFLSLFSPKDRREKREGQAVTVASLPPFSSLGEVGRRRSPPAASGAVSSHSKRSSLIHAQDTPHARIHTNTRARNVTGIPTQSIFCCPIRKVPVSSGASTEGKETTHTLPGLALSLLGRRLMFYSEGNYLT